MILKFLITVLSAFSYEIKEKQTIFPDCQSVTLKKSELPRNSLIFYEYIVKKLFCVTKPFVDLKNSITASKLLSIENIPRKGLKNFVDYLQAPDKNKIYISDSEDKGQIFSLPVGLASQNQFVEIGVMVNFFLLVSFAEGMRIIQQLFNFYILIFLE